MEVDRPIYLKRLIDRMDNGSAKVVTGVRRCGKSYLLGRFFRNHLLSNDSQNRSSLRSDASI